MICKINISTKCEKLRAFSNNINVNIIIMMILAILHDEHSNNSKNNGSLGNKTCMVHQFFLNSLHRTKGRCFAFQEKKIVLLEI